MLEKINYVGRRTAGRSLTVLSKYIKSLLA